MRKKLLLLMLLLVLGCTAAPTLSLNGTIIPPPGLGYAIVSVTGLSVHPDSTHLEIRYRAIDNAVYGSIHVNLFQDTIFSRVPGGAITEGKIVLLRLPPGQYRFDGAYGSYSEEWLGGKIYSFPFTSEFTVNEQEAIYLGEIRLDLSLKPELVVSDQHVRDFGHIERLWHIKDLSPIKIKLISAHSQ